MILMKPIVDKEVVVTEYCYSTSVYLLIILIF